MTELRSMIRHAASDAGFNNIGTPDLDISIAVCLAESGGNPWAISPPNHDGTIDRGLWQINSIHGPLFVIYNWANSDHNALMAFSIFKDAHFKWTPWSTFNDGSYRKFM